VSQATSAHIHDHIGREKGDGKTQMKIRVTVQITFLPRYQILVVRPAPRRTLVRRPIGPHIVITLPVGRVLVVDDNVDLALLFSDLIGMMGYETHAVFSVDAALEVLFEFSPHAVFSDIEMPGLSGYDLARAIRAGTWPQPFLVSVSSRYDEQTVYVSRKSGFDLHLGKPVSYDQIAFLLMDYFQYIGIGPVPQGRGKET
jgi:CheY-like chemotaxis protein